MMKKFKYWFSWIPASYLCLRFRFLYPRNRFSDRHYTNWKVLDKIDEINRKINKFGEFKNEDERKEYFVKKYGENCLFKGEYLTLIDSKFIYKHESTFVQRIEIKCLEFWHKFLEILHFIPTDTELDSMPDGWRKAFGIQMCKEIKHALIQAGKEHGDGRKVYRQYRIRQIKEKFGALCWYDNAAPREVSDIINKYEYISYYTCIDCGKVARYLSQGWICPYCEEHIKLHYYQPQIDTDRNVLYDENEKAIPLERSEVFGYQDYKVQKMWKLVNNDKNES